MKENTGWWICAWLFLIYWTVSAHMDRGIKVVLADGSKCEQVVRQ